MPTSTGGKRYDSVLIAGRGSEAAMYRRVILAYDGSTAGRAMLREGALLAKRCGAEVFLLSVIPDSLGLKLVEGDRSAAVAAMAAQYQPVLDEGVRRLRELGFTASGRLTVGEPIREIGAFAREISANLVIVAYRPQSALQRWWSGSENALLIDRIGCSVLVCRSALTEEQFASELARVSGAGEASRATPVA
jgi:nucleotide-binding universal stress UspA family protein